MSTQHRSFLLASLLPAFLLVSVFAVVQAQSAGSPAASRWSDPATWPDKKVPAKDDVVTIEKDMNVILDVSPPPLHGIKLDGTLSFADNKDLELTTEWIMVHGDVGDWHGSQAPTRARRPLPSPTTSKTKTSVFPQRVSRVTAVTAGSC